MDRAKSNLQVLEDARDAFAHDVEWDGHQGHLKKVVALALLDIALSLRTIAEKIKWA